MRLFLVLVLASCAVPRRPPREPMLVQRAAVITQDAVNLTFDVDNPNRAPLTLRAVNWSLSADDDTPVARGRAELTQTLAPGRNTVNAALPLQPGRAARVQGLLSSGASLVLEGLLHFSAATDDVAVPFVLTPSAAR